MEDFIRGFVVETFSGSMIDVMSEELDVFLRIVFNESFLWDESSDESVGVFDGTFFPGGIWMTEVGFAWKLVMVFKFDTVIESDSLDVIEINDVIHLGFNVLGFSIGNFLNDSVPAGSIDEYENGCFICLG